MILVVFVGLFIWAIHTLGEVRRVQRDLYETLRRVEAKLSERPS